VQEPVENHDSLNLVAEQLWAPRPSQMPNADCGEPRLKGGMSFRTMKLRLVGLAVAASGGLVPGVGRRRECRRCGVIAAVSGWCHERPDLLDLQDVTVASRLPRREAGSDLSEGRHRRVP
jgi:hypothetical protein